jgi:hypothetical protein
MRITIALLLITLVLLSGAVSGRPHQVNEIFSKAEIDAVISGTIITDVIFFDEFISTMTGRTADHMQTAVNLLHQPSGGFSLIASEKAFIPLTAEGFSQLKKLLASAGSLSGMKYYSVSGREVKVFITASSAAGSAAPSARGPDGSLRQEGVLKITDNMLGLIEFNSVLTDYGSLIILENISSKPMSKFGIEICRTGGNRTVSIFFYDRQRKGVFYCSVHAMEIRTAGILKIAPVKPASFGNRLRASLVHLTGLLGLDWSGKIAAFK